MYAKPRMAAGIGLQSIIDLIPTLTGYEQHLKKATSGRYYLTMGY